MERSRVTFTANSKRELVPPDHVFVFFTLVGSHQESASFTVHSRERWHGRKVARIPQQRNKGVTSLSGKVSLHGEYGHTNVRHFKKLGTIDLLTIIDVTTDLLWQGFDTKKDKLSDM